MQKAIQRRGPGHSVNRRTLKTEKLLCSSPSRKSALMETLDCLSPSRNLFILSHPWRFSKQAKRAPSMVYRARELNTNLFFLNFSGAPRISRKIPEYPAKKFGFTGLRGTYRNFLAPTRARGRPVPHRKISGHESLGLCSFFVPKFFKTASIVSGPEKRGHYERGLFTEGISRISRISRKWSDSALFSHSLGWGVL